MSELDLRAVMARYSKALDAKPGNGGITADGIAAITDSVADVPQLLAEIERLRERAANDAKFRASVIDALLDALGITDDTTPEDARQILDGCSCDGEEGTLHLVWHLGQKVERLTRWKAEALPVMDGLQELGRALGLPLGARITGPLAYVAAEALNTRAEAAEATIDCVRNLADWHETKAEKARRYPGSEPEIMAKAASVHDDAARRIRRALGGQS